VPWETGVKLDSIANNIDTEPGDQKQRVIKFEIGVTAETFIPQPIRRDKAVLDVNVNIFRNLNLEDTKNIIDTLEVKEKDNND
jgi:hypothetical protein